MEVKPLILELDTAKKIAQYYFRRDLDECPLELLENKDDLLNIMMPSDEYLVEHFLSEHPDEKEFKKEYKKSKSELCFYDWIINNNSEFDYYYENLIEEHYPLWNYVWKCPDNYINSSYMNVDKLFELGIGVIDHEQGYYLFIAEAGYDFYEEHWIPMFKEMGLIKEEKEIKEIINSLPEVENMSSNEGNDVPNQFIIRGKDYTLFKSYSSPIVLKKDGNIYIFENWDYSKTTGKYRNLFLGEDKKETLRKIKSGIYIPVGFKIE